MFLGVGRTTTIDDAIAYRREERTTGQSGATELVFRPDAEPPFDAFEQLRGDRDFKRVWEHKRTDLPDQSTDTYDRAIAVHAVRAGWTDQQVVNLVIYHRVQQISR
ncbi:MAG TPA: hypothetical protein VN442_24220 [Bryobacteraceae bacterium]|nr:hypothetical protein [Bryobacteraceae bacterium]